VKVLCLDEIAQHKGHGSFLLIISAPELGLVLDVLPDRCKDTLEAWFDARGSEWCATVEVACADLWKPYHLAIAAKLPNARPIADRFHVMKSLNDAVTKLRRTIQREATDPVREVLKGCRWLLVKNRETLTDEERQELDTMFNASPALRECYMLKEDFRKLFDLPDRHTASQSLDGWLKRARGTGHRAMLAFVRTVETWRDAILNYFDDHWSNGFAEGVNNKIKLIKRRGYGYPNFEQFRLHILVAFGD